MQLDACQSNLFGVEVLSTGKCPDIAAPTIQEDDTSDLGQVEVFEGEELELRCYSEGTPTPTSELEISHISTNYYNATEFMTAEFGILGIKTSCCDLVYNKNAIK